MRALFFIGLLFTQVSHAAFFNSYDWESRNWHQITPMSGNTYVAGTRWMLQTRAAGLRKSIMRANLMAGTTLAAALKPIVNTYGDAVDGETGSAGTYSEANGVTYTPAGSSMIYTGLNPTSIPLNSASMAIYTGGTPGQNGNVDIGAQTFASLKFFSMVTAFTGSGQTANVWTNSGSPLSTDTNGTGWYMGSRISTATNGVSIYRNGVMVGRSTLIGSSQPSTAGSASPGLYVLGLNNSGSPILASSRAGRGYQIGQGFNDVQAGASARIWHRFQVTLGRAVAP